MNDSENENAKEDTNEKEITNEDESDKKKKGKSKEEIYEEEFAIIPPNGGWGWVVVFCAFYCNVVLDGIQLTFGTFLEAIANDLGVQHSEVALAGSLIYGIHLLMGSICSGCTEVFGLRPVTIVGCIICCSGIALSYFANNVYVLCITYGVIGGIGLGLVYMNTLMVTSLYFTSYMPLAIGIVVCGSGVGTMIFAVLGFVSLKKTTWRYSFLMQAALVGTMVFAAATFKPLKPVKVKIKVPTPSVVGPQPSKMSLPHTSTPTHSTDKRASVFVKDFTKDSVTSDMIFRDLWAKFLERKLVTEVAAESHTCRCCKRSKCYRLFACCKCRRKQKEKILILTPLSQDDKRLSYQAKIPENLREENVPSVEYFKRVLLEENNITRKLFGALKRTIIAALDYHLLKSTAFTLFTISGAVQLAVFLIVYIYETDRCKSLGFSEEMSMYFLVTLGGSNTFWRLFFGSLALLPKTNQAAAIVGTVIGGIAVISSGFSDSPYYQFAFCFFFGMGMACFAVFRVVLLVELMGWERLPNATGINLVLMGIFCIVFPPLLGYATEMMKNYDVVFCISGALLVFTGLLQIVIPKIRKKELQKLPKDRSNQEI